MSLEKFFRIAFTLLWMLASQAAFGQVCPPPSPNGSLAVRSSKSTGIEVVDGASFTLTTNSLSTGNVYWYRNGSFVTTTGTSKSYTFTMTQTGTTGNWTVAIGATQAQAELTGFTGESTDVSWVENEAAIGGAAADIEALKLLYYSTDGSNWANVPAAWTIGGVRVGWSPAQWDNTTTYTREQRFPGVVFDNCNRVTRIVLSGYLKGTLPQGNDFAKNGAWSELTTLVLSCNSSNCTAGSPNLTGTIPVTINRLKKLKNLHLSGNNLAGGGIPSSIGDLTDLEVLMLDGAGPVGGGIPSSIVNLTKLKKLGLNGLGLTGAVPSLVAISGLRYLELGSNSGITSLPSDLGNVTTLDTLRIRYCTGLTSVPASLSNPSLSLKFAWIFDIPITSLPQLNAAELTTLTIHRCRLDFNSILQYPTVTNYQWFDQPNLPLTSCSSTSLSVSGFNGDQWQWYLNTTSSPVSGGNTATLTLVSGVSPAGKYFCRINKSWNSTPTTKFLQTVSVSWNGSSFSCPPPPVARPGDSEEVKQATSLGGEAPADVAYPNPVRDGELVSIRIGGADVSELSYTVIDAAGVTRRTGRAGLAGGLIQVSLDGLSVGLYTITYVAGGTPHAVKVVKQ